MKNFSVKTADFDSLSISGESPIVQSDLGTAPNQIPLNKDLGSLAYMNAPQIEDLNVDTLELREIAAELSETAVDVFVYDTRRDSDGGAWRHRTSHTSWYNEELNTATRGSRREFPAVAVIVAETNKVTIYDGDDPDLSMWMVFDDGGNSAYLMTRSATCISAINGSICAGCDDNNNYGHILYVNFISDIMQRWSKQDGYTESYRSGTGISTRNGTFENILDTTTPNLVNKHINDVAMTVLPNAPIDADTGLPVPTIAVATDGGVSVIKDDGSVVDKGTTSAAVNQVQWMGSGRLVATAPAYYGVFDDPFMEESAAFLGYISDSVYNQDYTKNHLYQVPNLMAQLDANSKLLTLDTRTIIASTSAGLNVHEMGEGAAANNNHGIATYITSKYNTGWMPGDIKLATLSDTKIETVVGELIINGTFDDGTTGWDFTRADVINGVFENTSKDSLTCYADQIIQVTTGKTYNLSFDILENFVNTQNGVYIKAQDDSVSYFDIRKPNGETGSFNYTFTAPASSLLIRLYKGNSDGTIKFDNISVRLTEEDRSVNDNGLHVFGEITKSPVAPGADLVAYSGFSVDNYLMQPYNSDLDFGTGDFCAMAWFNYQSIATTHFDTLFSLSNFATLGWLDFGSLVFQINNQTNQVLYVFNTAEKSATCAPGVWNHALLKRENSIVYIYLNGKKVHEYFDDISIDGSDKEGWQLLVGDLGNLHYADLSKLALLRISATAPTAEQIAKIYRDEKPLFQDGAQATLYGTSDAVTALAYDDKTELLHVGTSSGRSDFSGLRRINNTTTAVTTSISASNNLIAEQ